MRRLALTILTPLLAATLAACSAGAAASPSSAATAAPSAPAGAEASAAAGTVSANTATRDELVTALTAAGVANPDRWAREIEEYRPYDTSDPTLAHLQDELAKYDPDPATLAAILSALQP